MVLIFKRNLNYAKFNLTVLWKTMGFIRLLLDSRLLRMESLSFLYE